MITVNGILVKPTIFPDGTSQIWKLPNELFLAKEANIVWNFENEREIIDICSLVQLLSAIETIGVGGALGLYTRPAINLHIPYLPYARQDKEVTNDSTFNLHVLASILNTLNLNRITTVDAHNPSMCREIITKFENIYPSEPMRVAMATFEPDTIAFPDAGALNRYGESQRKTKAKVIFFEKKRNQLTGVIEGHKLFSAYSVMDRDTNKVLIIDDLCDGGATFISVAKTIHEINPEIEVGLYVTHGIFSRGREHLLNNGISKIFTTNSLLKNEDGYKV